MLNICSVKTGTKYGAEYVNILFDMIRRNLPDGTPGRFICFTDDPSGLSEGIETRPIPSDLKTWWAKLYLFAPGVLPEGERVLYFDLDTVITGPLDRLLEYSGEFAMLRDPFKADWWNSGIMAWRGGIYSHIWSDWIAAGMPEIEGGDQIWIKQCLKTTDFLQDLYPERFKSFKLDCFDGKPPRKTMVVYFHGEPKPHNCGAEWVEMIWKIGGGTSAELEVLCNSSDAVIASNIRAACSLPFEWLAQHEPHERHAVIVGGGPSLKTQVESIRTRKECGETIIATNNTANWLIENGIQPDMLVIVDARAENAKFVPAPSNLKMYLASQCHQEVFERAKGFDTVLWHCHGPVLESAIENPEKKPECFIAAGCTVGLSAMAIAYALGYRKLHIYGMDSSYEEDKHHAYEQVLNSGEEVIEVECEGKKFKAAAWMIAQADHFQQLIGLLSTDCDITVHGAGLIPWISLHWQVSENMDTHILEIDGLWWPSRDVICRPSVLAQVEVVNEILESCPNRGVVVQAGGNCGVFPRELSKHFARVITLEPDPLNFECLQRNTLNIENIERHQAALSDCAELKGLVRRANNCGAHCICEGTEFETITIDSLELDACDLIQLDVEGYELRALRGAEDTIKKFHPMIAVELNGLGQRYGDGNSAVIAWLEAHGYCQKFGYARDVIFTYNGELETCQNIAHTPPINQVVQ